MPKIVDHEERRHEIGAAVLRIVSEHGLSRLTVRSAAREAGWSTGVLAHYVGNKRDLLALGFDTLVSDLTSRIQAIDRESSLAWLHGVLTELLPADKVRRREMRAWFAFVSASATEPELGLGASLRKGHARLRGLLAEALSVARERAEIRSDLDPTETAAGLLALADGIALHHLLDRRAMPPKRMAALLQSRIDELRA